MTFFDMERIIARLLGIEEKLDRIAKILEENLGPQE